MGMGRNSSRIATRRIQVANYANDDLDQLIEDYSTSYTSIVGKGQSASVGSNSNSLSNHSNLTPLKSESELKTVTVQAYPDDDLMSIINSVATNKPNVTNESNSIKVPCPKKMKTKKVFRSSSATISNPSPSNTNWNQGAINEDTQEIELLKLSAINNGLTTYSSVSISPSPNSSSSTSSGSTSMSLSSILTQCSSFRPICKTPVNSNQINCDKISTTSSTNSDVSNN
jgi:hypothetical protein